MPVKIDTINISLTAALASTLFVLPAYAGPGDPQTGCLDNETLPQALGLEHTYMLYDEDDPEDGRINLRSEPTTSSSLVYVAESRNPITIFEQVFREDGYCWLRVEVLTFSEANPGVLTPVNGWVRSDLIALAWD